jgi:hypothetical protein
LPATRPPPHHTASPPRTLGLPPPPRPHSTSGVDRRRPHYRPMTRWYPTHPFTTRSTTAAPARPVSPHRTTRPLPPLDRLTTERAGQARAGVPGSRSHPARSVALKTYPSAISKTAIFAAGLEGGGQTARPPRRSWARRPCSVYRLTHYRSAPRILFFDAQAQPSPAQPVRGCSQCFVAENGTQCNGTMNSNIYS